jgi:hypothetical protein
MLDYLILDLQQIQQHLTELLILGYVWMMDNVQGQQYQAMETRILQQGLMLNGSIFFQVRLM